MNENVYYLYGFKKGENRLKAKPIEVASVPFEELLEATQQAKDMGFVDVYALTKALRWGHYRLRLADDLGTAAALARCGRRV
jgi:hypothetical protein